MKRDTRQLIIEKGAPILHQKGYHDTGIQEILNAADVPKGSFYFYFKSKEEFGLAAVDFYNEYFAGRFGEFMQTAEGTPLQKLKRFFEEYHDYFESIDYALGCPIGNLSTEMGDINESFRVKLHEALDLMKGHVLGVLNAAQEQGEISAKSDTDELAEFFVNAWEGALIRMKVTKSRKPLDLFIELMFNRILK